MNSKYSKLATKIKAEAKRLGFFACGAARAEKVDKDTARRVRTWIEKGGNAEMGYMANHTDKRLDPGLLVPGTKTILSLAMNYAPAEHIPPEGYQIAAYAYGRDYHEVMKEKLRELLQRLNEADALPPLPADGNAEIRTFVDTAPVLERYWAWRCGLGWVGKNHQLIIPHAGSMFFLGEIFLPFELDAYDEPMRNHCGNCQRCIDACPTAALGEDKEFDSAKCLSYQLIENRGELSDEAKRTMGNCIYGCDRCQQACPWNRFAIPSDNPDFMPRRELLSMTKEEWNNLTIEEYRRLFKGSAVKRAKYEGLKRNIKAAGTPPTGDKNQVAREKSFPSMGRKKVR